MHHSCLERDTDKHFSSANLNSPPVCPLLLFLETASMPTHPMALTPDSKRYLRRLLQIQTPDLSQLTAQGAREVSRLLDDLYRWDPGVAVESLEILVPGAKGSLPARVFRPKGLRATKLPVLLYFHGGGWVLGGHADPEIVSTCSYLASAARCAVVSVGYRLAPESKFPAPVEDAYSALSYVSSGKASTAIDPARVAVGGDSAGGNIAAALCLMTRDRAGPAITFQLLVYPATDLSFETASHREYGEGYGLSREEMKWYWNHYLRTPEDGDDPYASPLRARDLGGLPPALVLTAEYDPLRDEGEAYARRLASAGVRTRMVRYDGAIHGFFTLPFGQEGRKKAAAALKGAFSTPRR